jgi:hypothetical protein
MNLLHTLKRMANGEHRHHILASILLILLFFAFLPISGALWAEQLRITAKIFTGTWQGQNGTTLTARKTALGFSEEHNGEFMHGVRGEICVENGGNVPTEQLEIIDTIQVKNGKTFKDYYTTPIDLSAKPVLEPGESFCYPYEIIFDPVGNADTTYRNIAKVTITNHSGWLPGDHNCPGTTPCPFGPTVKATFQIPAPPLIQPTATPTEPSLTNTPTLTEIVDTETETSTPESTPTKRPKKATPTPTPPPPTQEPPTEPPPTQPPTEPPPTETPTPGS